MLVTSSIQGVVNLPIFEVDGVIGGSDKVGDAHKAHTHGAGHVLQHGNGKRKMHHCYRSTTNEQHICMFTNNATKDAMLSIFALFVAHLNTHNSYNYCT